MMELLPLADGAGYGFLHRADPRQRSRATLVLLNAGLIHRVGPFRMNLELAERVARDGIDVFRFDLPAVGDAPAGGGHDREEHVRMAMDAVAAATGSDRFIVGGICSAADLAWRMPERDPRVRGILLLDPCAVRGPWFRVAQLRHFLSRGPAEWGHILQRRIARFRGNGDTTLARRNWPSARQFAAGNRRMAEDGVGIYALYTAGVTEYFLDRRQIAGSFPGLADRPGMRLQFRPDIDHILFVPRQRAEVVDDIAQWLDGMLPA